MKNFQNAKHPTRNFQKLMTCRFAENRIISNYFNMAVYANYEFVANTTKGEEEGCEGVVSIG